MTTYSKNINNLLFIFIISHLIIWTFVPVLTNKNLPLDTIEALAWGSNLDWGFNKHPPASAFFAEMFFKIFGSQDWSYYLLSQIFVVVSFIYVFKFASEIFNNKVLSLISLVLLEAIFFYNYTTPEFNVNICQLPFWSLTVYYSWKIYKNDQINFTDCFLLSLFASIGFLSKYLFLYLLISIVLLFIYLIFFKKEKKFDFKYLIALEVFVIILVPHLIWLKDNNFITIKYGLARASLENSDILDHVIFPIIFLLKQIGLLIPFLFLVWLLIKKFKFNLNFKDKKLIFLITINLLPILFMAATSLITGSKLRTMWMTPFYLFFGVLFVYIFRSQINLKKLNSFLYSFLILFFLSPAIYAYISISNTNKRTDYPGNEIANKVQYIWDLKFNTTISEVMGDEWSAGNLSYHLKSRPVWKGLVDQKKINEYKDYMCIDNICIGSK